MIFGMMRDKDIENYIKIFKNRVKDWIATGLDSSRASSAAEISEFLNGENISNVIKANNPAEAIDEAKKVSHNYDAVIVSGSFELIGPVKNPYASAIPLTNNLKKLNGLKVFSYEETSPAKRKNRRRHR